MEFFNNINNIFFLVAYLVGGIPFGLILAKMFANVDIKQSGSKSIGATNVLRVVKEKNPTLAKKLAIATILLDAFKGIAVLLVAKFMGMPDATLWAIAVLAVAGHCFSPYLMFEGGKGVATGVGVLAFMLPDVTAIALVVWFILGKTLRISSLASLGALAALIIASYVIYPEIPNIYSHAPIWIISIIVVYKHIPNIIRLIKGQEKRVA
ncbi:glycerol-3-phosphate 1-O-acyltransferase PlsY [Hydrogenimonas thermophila]|uniref:Glycerol-3-phosphate acyltransferase n=1 Tax=Hydrogenimonas thermophila TaxID=223786 RepID=A0A1I5SWU2_9BACT|nr:glycerol-3-phosphate 1-O-acyltransferase PlsY [Hydrogenimonas thermophila]WOE70413.1 glycerol-3-phosphate 1-O-acyltransferase PlsY [Hydrogenimonas thermophila]WOE72928.1 glycerol-3-phosphate 1-O-acyltransferase PlsY [Hydrogenimonas thermophila]SFP75209.1 acyl-phosphate glycerol-3-phosphate acyltransferase [Hydrogenimonas thermophila]